MPSITATNIQIDPQDYETAHAIGKATARINRLAHEAFCGTEHVTKRRMTLSDSFIAAGVNDEILELRRAQTHILKDDHLDDDTKQARLDLAQLMIEDRHITAFAKFVGIDALKALKETSALKTAENLAFLKKYGLNTLPRLAVS